MINLFNQIVIKFHEKPSNQDVDIGLLRKATSSFYFKLMVWWKNNNKRTYIIMHTETQLCVSTCSRDANLWTLET